MPVKTIEWIDNKIRIIDQTQLPQKVVYLDIDTLDDLAEAICLLRIRGAPAIGVAGAMGVALAAMQYSGSNVQELEKSIHDSIVLLGKTRPTAVNLFWALDRMKKCVTINSQISIQTIQDTLLQEALNVLEEDKNICRQLGMQGANLLSDGATVLTHCNAGGLATSEYGTALAVIYQAVEDGKRVRVYADETRPLLQGARLTAWELQASGIDVTVICDSVAGFLMQQGKIDCVIVGADRIAGNGDVANKVGTYMLAVLAHAHKVPFYVAAPISTFDFTLSSGQSIPIEERSEKEVSHGFGKQTIPDGVKVYNPAFDMTPNSYVTAIVTEKGILNPPFDIAIQKLQP